MSNPDMTCPALTSSVLCSMVGFSVAGAEVALGDVAELFGDGVVLLGAGDACLVHVSSMAYPGRFAP